MRDCSRRGYTTDQVLAEIDRRESDADTFIRPQRGAADMVVRFSEPDAADREPAPTTSTPICCCAPDCRTPTSRT